MWVHEAREREASGDSSGIRSTRDVSPPSPTKSRLAATAASGVASRRGSLINSANASTTTVPTITTTTTSNMSPPATTETFGARVRKMSTKLGTLPVVQPISSAPVTPMMNGGGSNSAGSSMLDLGLLSGSTTTGTASGASTPGGSLALATHPPHEGLSRSHSSKLSLSLALSGSDSRSSTSSSSRAAARKAAAAAEEERRAAEEKEREEERMDQLVKECGIEVSEVSAKDDFGACACAFASVLRGQLICCSFFSDTRQVSRTCFCSSREDSSTGKRKSSRIAFCAPEIPSCCATRTTRRRLLLVAGAASLARNACCFRLALRPPSPTRHI